MMLIVTSDGELKRRNLINSNSGTKPAIFPLRRSILTLGKVPTNISKLKTKLSFKINIPT